MLDRWARMEKCARRGSGSGESSSLSIPLSDIDGVSQCDPEIFLREAACLQAESERDEDARAAPSRDTVGGVEAKASAVLGSTISISSTRGESEASEADTNARERHKSFRNAIARSKRIHLNIRNWERQMGHRSFSRTMSNTAATRILLERLYSSPNSEKSTNPTKSNDAQADSAVT